MRMSNVLRVLANSVNDNTTGADMDSEVEFLLRSILIGVHAAADELERQEDHHEEFEDRRLQRTIDRIRMHAAAGKDVLATIRKNGDLGKNDL